MDMAVEKFGGIDILINNASAIQNVSVEEMDVKRYDLIQSINSRGTFVCSKFAIPYLKKAKNPHILTISPPLYAGNDQVNWGAKLGTGYFLGKFGMTLITHGLAGELKEDGIACNTLWPRTSISTAAIKNVLGGDSAMEITRKEAIMSDAAYVILTSNSKTTTGWFQRWLLSQVPAASKVLKNSSHKSNGELHVMIFKPGSTIDWLPFKLRSTQFQTWMQWAEPLKLA